VLLIFPLPSTVRGDVQNFGGCQAPVSPVLTQALREIKKLNY
jgi:hypothetical protein